jgi:hypothetical protein
VLGISLQLLPKGVFPSRGTDALGLIRGRVGCMIQSI